MERRDAEIELPNDERSVATEVQSELQMLVTNRFLTSLGMTNKSEQQTKVWSPPCNDFLHFTFSFPMTLPISFVI